MSEHSTPFRAAIVIGRFQPFHNGHLALVQRALSLAPRVLVVVGSARSARTPRNPWTHEERAQMILGALPEAARSRVTCLPLRDYYDEPRWRKALVQEVTTALGGSADEVVVVGHFKDATSDYLRGFAGWALDSLPLQGDVHATPLRELYLSSLVHEQEAALLDLSHKAPPSSVDHLRAFRTTPAYATLVHELKSLKGYENAWSKAPFPPVFVTVDAVVTCARQILLIQRGNPPGKGLWALPGGFLELAETTLQSSLRELSEETGLVLRDNRAIPVANAVFDHPDRSLRGRTISHAFHFDLGVPPQPPRVLAADDAQDCRWVPLEDVLAMESRLLDDHLLIIDHFLHVLPRS